MYNTASSSRKKDRTIQINDTEHLKKHFISLGAKQDWKWSIPLEGKGPNTPPLPTVDSVKPFISRLVSECTLGNSSGRSLIVRFLLRADRQSRTETTTGIAGWTGVGKFTVGIISCGRSSTWSCCWRSTSISPKWHRQNAFVRAIQT